MPHFDVVEKKQPNKNFEKILFALCIVWLIIGLFEFANGNKQNIVLLIFAPIIYTILYLFKIFVTRKKQQPLVEINEHSLSWFWHGMTTKKIVLFKEILWAKKERDNIYFFSQSSFSECFPLHELHPINAEKIEALIVKELHENKVQYLVK